MIELTKKEQREIYGGLGFVKSFIIAKSIDIGVELLTGKSFSRNAADLLRKMNSSASKERGVLRSGFGKAL